MGRRPMVIAGGYGIMSVASITSGPLDKYLLTPGFEDQMAPGADKKGAYRPLFSR